MVSPVGLGSQVRFRSGVVSRGHMMHPSSTGLRAWALSWGSGEPCRVPSRRGKGSGLGCEITLAAM